MFQDFLVEPDILEAGIHVILSTMGSTSSGNKRAQARKDRQDVRKTPARPTKVKPDRKTQIVTALILVACAGVALFKLYLMVADAGGLSLGSHVTRVSVSDEKMLKRVFKDPEPWVVVCNPDEATDRNAGALAFACCGVAARRARLAMLPLSHRLALPAPPRATAAPLAALFASPAAPPLFEETAKRVAKLNIKFALMNCGDMLPSGVDVFERFKIKEETKYPTVLSAWNGKKVKKIPPSKAKSPARFAKFLRSATQVSKSLIVNDRGLQKLCDPKKSKSSDIACVLLLSPGAYSKKKELQQTFKEMSSEGFARAMRYGIIDTTKLKFLGGLKSILEAAMEASSPAPEEDEDEDDRKERLQMMRARLHKKPHLVVVRKVEKDTDTAPVGLVAVSASQETAVYNISANPSHN